MSEQIRKLQPNRTMALRGFDALGASAALHSATADSFQVSGVFRDSADFAVLLLWDVDNFYEHPRLKYLPDFDFHEVVLSFDVEYSAGLQPLDSPKYNWIDWATLDCIREDSTTAQIRLWDHCMLQSGSFTAATGSFHLVTGADGIQPYDRITLFFQNIAYDFIAPATNASVEYQFYAGGLGTAHTITINGRVYTHTESAPSGESSADQANGLIAAMNEGAGDPQVVASLGSTSYSVKLTARPGQSAAVTGTGNVAASIGLASVENVAASLAAEINSTDWWTAIPTHALRASATGATITVIAARYGHVATNGTTVTWISGAMFTGIIPGAGITISGVAYTVASVESVSAVSLTTSAGVQTSAPYTADRGGADGNMIRLYALHKTESLKTVEDAILLEGGNSEVTWHCQLDFTALGIDHLRQCWLTFAPALANGTPYTDTEWLARFTNWSTADPNHVSILSVAGPNSVRVEDSSGACKYTGAWATATPESGFFSRGLARRAGSPSVVTGETVTVTYSCIKTHDLYLGTSLYTDRATVGVQLDGDAETELNCFLQTEPAVNTRRKLRSAVPPGTHRVTLRVNTTGYFYFDFLEAAVVSDVPDALPPRNQVSPALDYSTDHSYKLPPSRILWILDQLGLTGPVNQYIGVFWWNQRNNPTAQFPSLTLVFQGAWADGDTVCLDIGGTPLWKSVFPADTANTIAAHFAFYINEVFVGAWAYAQGPVLTITARSPAYSFTFAKSIASSASGTVTASGSLQGGQMGTWMVDPTQSPALNRGARDWHADLYANCRQRGREVVTAGSMELVNPPAGFAAKFPDGKPVATDVGFASLHSTHCAQSSLMLAYQKAMFDCIADLQSAAGLTPNIQMGEYLWWFFTNYSSTANPTGGMAFYDAETKAAAQATLGRPLHIFQQPTDDPTVNNSADAVFLRNRLRDHVASIVSHLQSRYPDVQCEVLFAYDVNYPTVNNGVGGALNHFINFPVEWRSKTSAGFQRLKVEALSFGGTSRNLDLAFAAIQFPLQQSWPIDSVRYLVPIFVHSSAWEKELAAALALKIPVVNLWAFDQMCIFGLKPTAGPIQARSGKFAVPH